MNCRNFCDKWKKENVVEDFEIVDSKEIQCYYEQSELAGLFLDRDYEAARRAIMTEYKLSEWTVRMCELMEAKE